LLKDFTEPPPRDSAKEPPYRRLNDSDNIQRELCPFCKSDKLVKSGTCKVCSECGTTTGCG